VTLFWQVLSTEARTRMSYRADFWINAVVGFIVEFGLAWYLWGAMFRESGEERMGGYTFQGMVVYYLSVVLLGKMIRGREFEGAVSHDIYEGGLNRYLLYPAHYFPIKFAQRIGSLVPAFLQFALFLGVAVFFVDIPGELMPTAGSVLRAAGCVVVGMTLYFIMDFCIHLVAFWADNVWSLDVAKWFIASILGGYMLPVTLFPDWAQAVIAWLPFRYFFDFPVRVLLGRIGPLEWAAGMALCLCWCTALLGVAGLVWRRGTLQYSGVGI